MGNISLTVFFEIRKYFEITKVNCTEAEHWRATSGELFCNIYHSSPSPHPLGNLLKYLRYSLANILTKYIMDNSRYYTSLHVVVNSYIAFIRS